MQNRVPTYPGRVKLIPVQGQENTYDMERADQPTQVGTPLNKASLLKDSTAALYGLGTDAVPDDVLKLLGNNIYAGLGNQYLWKKLQYSPQKTAISDLGVGRPIVTTSKSSTIYYSEEVSFSETGEVSLKDPVSQPDTWVLTNYTVLRGKYFYNKETGDIVTADKILWFSEDANFPTEIGVGKILVNSGAFLVSSTSVNIGYVNSADPDAYPPAEPDGYTYTALGQVGSKVRIETGSYMGTGTYGASNPNSLTFGFVPKLVLVGSGKNWLMVIWGVQPAFYSADTYMHDNVVSFSGRIMQWYYSKTSNQGASNQLNAKGGTYNYIAIG